MDKRLSENQIAFKLLLQSKESKATAEFRNRLLNGLDQELGSRKPSIFTYINNIMNKKLMTGLVVVIALIAVTGGTVYVLNRKDNTGTTLTSEVPRDLVKNLDEAKGKVTFAIKVPSKKIKTETLSEVRVGIKQQYSPIDESDSVFLTYKDGSKTLYTVNQTTKAGNWPTDGEKVKINGVDGMYYKIPGEESSNNTPNSANALIPRAYIFWKEGNVTYSINEYGEVSKDQLVTIANSLQDYK